MSKTITISKKKPRNYKITAGAVVIIDDGRTGIVQSSFGDQLNVLCEKPNWPFPDLEIRKVSQVKLVAVELERQYEEALL